MSKRRIFHKLVPLDSVLDIISGYYPLEPKGVEEVCLENALGRVLAEDIYSPIDHPPFDRSIVDGYAVVAEDTYGAYEDNPVKLRVNGFVEAGVKPSVAVGRGVAVEVSTGAMVPRGANAVVMEEFTSRIGDYVLVYRSVVPGENIVSTGSDISFGDLVLLKGTLLTANEIGLLAGLGLDRVKVYKQVRVAVYSTGNEVVEPGSKLEVGRVYDVNGWLITCSLREIGVNACFKGLLPDNEDVIREALSKALEEYDIVITSGGTSAGLGDLVYRVFDSLGEPGVIIHGIMVKPGKPTVVAVVDNKLLIGLPGFPLSCFMILHKVVKPLIARLMGLQQGVVYRVKAYLPYRIRKPLGRAWLLPVALVKTSRGYTAYPVSMASGSISPIVNSDGYVVLGSGRDLFLENEVVDVELFGREPRIPEMVFIGSSDVLLYRVLVEAGLMSVSRVIVTGSLGGWNAVKRGEADIAPTHLLDEETLEYNKPFLEKLGIKDIAVLVRGYYRRIGIIVNKGNPKNIRGVEDFFRKDIRIVNRPKGAGARVLLDYLLKKKALEKGVDLESIPSIVNGYTYEVKTHTAVAQAVKQGRADAGIAIEYVAYMYNLDFIPLAIENYDFLVRKDSLEKHVVKKFLEYLKNSRFRELVENYPGYIVPEDIGKLL